MPVGGIKQFPFSLSDGGWAMRTSPLRVCPDIVHTFLLRAMAGGTGAMRTSPLHVVLDYVDAFLLREKARGDVLIAQTYRKG